MYAEVTCSAPIAGATQRRAWFVLVPFYAQPQWFRLRPGETVRVPVMDGAPLSGAAVHCFQRAEVAHTPVFVPVGDADCVASGYRVRVDAPAGVRTTRLSLTDEEERDGMGDKICDNGAVVRKGGGPLLAHRVWPELFYRKPALGCRHHARQLEGTAQIDQFLEDLKRAATVPGNLSGRVAEEERAVRMLTAWPLAQRYTPERPGHDVWSDVMAWPHALQQVPYDCEDGVLCAVRVARWGLTSGRPSRAVPPGYALWVCVGNVVMENAYHAWALLVDKRVSDDLYLHGRTFAEATAAADGAVKRTLAVDTTFPVCSTAECCAQLQAGHIYNPRAFYKSIDWVVVDPHLREDEGGHAPGRLGAGFCQGGSSEKSPMPAAQIMCCGSGEAADGAGVWRMQQARKPVDPAALLQAVRCILTAPYPTKAPLPPSPPPTAADGPSFPCP